MLVVYLIALIVGGALLSVTLILGGDADADVDVDVDADMDLDAGADGVDGIDVLLGWLPLTSLRFWTFFAAFFGLTGTVLAGWSMAGSVSTAAMAVSVGYFSGLMMDRAVRALRKNEPTSGIGERDVVGVTGQVLVPVGDGKTGKVRVNLKGRAMDLLAELEGEEELAVGESVMVLNMRDDGLVVVTRADKLEG